MRQTLTAAPAVVLMLSLAMPGPVSAQMFVAAGRDTLRGLPGVELAVEGHLPESMAAGIGTAAIRTDVEARLRAAGVTVYATQQQNPSLAKPYLYVHLTALELPGGQLAVSVQVQLRQTLRSPVTASNVVNAMTWDAHNLFSTPAGGAGLLRAAVLEMVDGFIADWRAVR